MTSYSIAKMTPTQLGKYLEDQIELFKRMGHSPSLAFSHQLEVGKDGYYHLTKRDKEIEVIDWDLDGRGVAIALHSKMKNDGFFSAEEREEDRLMFMETCTVEVKEVQGWEE